MHNDIPLFNKYYTEYLLNEVENGKIEAYMQEIFPFESKYAAGKSVISLPANFALLIPKEGNSMDYDNSILLYENLKLNETQASDQRLWSYLVHVRFWDYMRQRWALERFEEDKEISEEKTLNKKSEFLIWRYHLKTANRRRLIRNGISRLWWYAHLTIDKNRKDNYELTRILLSELDIAQNLLERAFGSNKEVLHGILDFFKDNPNLKREERRNIIKEINLIGGVKVISLLKKEDIYNLLQ